MLTFLGDTMILPLGVGKQTPRNYRRIRLNYISESRCELLGQTSNTKYVLGRQPSVHRTLSPLVATHGFQKHDCRACPREPLGDLAPQAAPSLLIGAS